MSELKFIGLGAQKAGTSWIYACLAEHPQICMPFKELHYFSKDENYAKGMEWYLDHFRTCGGKSVIGEFSTTYLHTPGAIERINLHFPHVKLLVSLRDPAERARSHFNNDVRAGLVEKSTEFSDTLRTNPEYLQRGLYSKQIEAVLNLSNPSNVLVVVLEESYRDPAQFIKKIYRFLGVDDTFRSTFLDRKINVSHIPRSIFLNNALDAGARLLRRMRMQSLVFALKKAGLAEQIRGVNSRNRDDDLCARGTELPAEFKSLLHEDRRRIEKILGKSLDLWAN